MLLTGEKLLLAADFLVDALELVVGGLQTIDFIVLALKVSNDGVVARTGVLNGGLDAIDRVSDRLRQLLLGLIQLSPGLDERWVLVRVFFLHGTHEHPQFRYLRPQGGDAFIRADLGDIIDVLGGLLILQDELPDNL